MKKEPKTSWWHYLPFAISIATLAIPIISIPHIRKELRRVKEESGNEITRLKKQVDVVNSASVYQLENPSPRPLWPMPGQGRTEVYHLVMQVFPLDGIGGLPHQVHVMKNVESGINEVGIFAQTKGFEQGTILETKVGETRVLSAEEADAVLKKFGRK